VDNKVERNLPEPTPTRQLSYDGGFQCVVGPNTLMQGRLRTARSFQSREPQWHDQGALTVAASEDVASVDVSSKTLMDTFRGTP